jgi:hypothetical protein
LRVAVGVRLVTWVCVRLQRRGIQKVDPSMSAEDADAAKLMAKVKKGNKEGGGDEKEGKKGKKKKPKKEGGDPPPKASEEAMERKKAAK